MTALGEVVSLFNFTDDGNAKAVAGLLDVHPHLLEARNPMYLTPLMLASRLGHAGVVALFLERGAHVNPAPGSWSALAHAIEGGHEEVVALLLNAGADVGVSLGHGGGSALWYAAARCRTRMVLQLLRHTRGVGVNVRARDKTTPLWWACYYGCVTSISALAAAGADYTIPGVRDLTPRTVAHYNCHTRAVAYLDWWAGGLSLPYVVHRARCVYEGCKSRAPSAPVRGYLKKRHAKRLAMPSVEVVPVHEEADAMVVEDKGPGDEGWRAPTMEDWLQKKQEEEKSAMLQYVMKQLSEELYTELMAGLTLPGWEKELGVKSAGRPKKKQKVIGGPASA